MKRFIKIGIVLTLVIIVFFMTFQSVEAGEGAFDPVDIGYPVPVPMPEPGYPFPIYEPIDGYPSPVFGYPEPFEIVSSPSFNEIAAFVYSLFEPFELPDEEQASEIIVQEKNQNRERINKIKIWFKSHFYKFYMQ